MRRPPTLLLLLCLFPAAAARAVPDVLDEAQLLLQAQRTGPDAQTLDRALEMVLARIRTTPSDARPWALLAWAQMLEHRFADALAAAATASALAPDQPEPIALMTDALIELGRYPQALESAQRLVDCEPGVRSWARVARLRFLYNDLPGAVDLMIQAATAAGERGEAAAWVRLELARLHLESGDLEAAASETAAASRAFPAHPGLASLQARLLTAQGRPEAALALYRESLTIRPSAEAAVAAWRLARRLGRDGDARHLGRLLDGLARLDAGGLSRRALAEHFAEAGETERALHLARTELAQRPDIYSHATLARVLARAGDREQAQAHARAALALSTPEARLQADMSAILGKRAS